jgi:AraC-like DNA-binding protein
VPEPTLPHERFDTTPEEARRRLEVWREAISVLFDVRPAEPAAAEEPIVLDNWLLGPAVLTAGSGPGFSYERPLHAIARDGRDLLMIQIYQEGVCRIRRGAPEAVSAPGDLVISDLSRPIATEETAFRNVNLLLPRSLLAPLLREPDAQGGRILRRSHPLAALVGRQLEELVLQAPRLPVSQAVPVLSATAQLIAAALNGMSDSGTAAGVKVALACELRRYVDQHLSDRGLTPEALAGRFGLSRATVYRLFKADDGVHHYLQRRRLERARLTLISPAHRHRTIAEIGEAAGYVHARDFIRAFRREFIVSPGEQREQARSAGKVRLRRKEGQLPAWAQWVLRVG